MHRLAMLLLCAIAVAGCTAPVSNGYRGLPPFGALGSEAAPRQDEDAAPGETTVNIPLWPLLEWTEQADGSSDVSALFLYASHTNPDGELESIRIVNWLSGPDYTVFFPLYYDVGPEGEEDTGIVPLAFWGTGYTFVPLGLSGWWRAEDGREHTWITPLYHETTEADGSLAHRHALTWFQTSEGWLLFPFAWGFGESTSRRTGVLPFWMSGPRGWFVPLLLTGRWNHSGGGGAYSLWVTPLYHHTVRPGYPTSFHLLNYYQDEHTKALFPLAYVHDDGRGGSHWGVLPLYLDGPGWWAAPVLLSGAFDRHDGSRSTWITPLFHRTARPEAEDSWHLLTYVQGPGYKVLFPLAYSVRDGAYRGVIPLWFGSPSGWLAPLLLSGSWSTAPGERTTWITPLAHHTSRAGGADSWHVLTYFQGPDYKVLFPLAYSVGPEGDEQRGLLPLWIDGPDFWVAPPLLSARWSDAPGETTTWVTPFFHHTSRDEGEDSWHLLTYAQGPGYQVLFPLAYRYGAPGRRHSGLVPLAFAGPDWWVAPLLLSGGWRSGPGQSTNWFTPLFHHTSRPDGPDSWHALNYFQGPGYKVFFPLAYSVGPVRAKLRGLLPLLMTWPRGWFSPVLLSGSWRGPADTATTLVTPLFHHTSRPDGPDSWHALNYFQGPDSKVFFPLAYSVGPEGDRHRGVVPLWFDGPDWTLVPPLLSAWWRAGDGSTSLWATPLYHHTHEADGRLRHRHLLNFVQAGDFNTLFPVWWNWTNARGDRRAFLAPLYWQSSYADGDFAASVLPPLFSYRRSTSLNTGLLWQSIPFSYQSAGDDWEFNLLWRLYHRRVQGELSTTVVGPLWYSETRPGLPMDYKLLGGLLARDVFETRGTYRNRWLWFLAGDEQPIESAALAGG